MDDEIFLKENNITISKITYSYDFPPNYKYNEHKRGYISNEQRYKFLQSIRDRLSKVDDENLSSECKNFHHKNQYFEEITYSHFLIIELKYYYDNKNYNININNERITFHNINYEYTDEVSLIILDFIGYTVIEMGKYEIHNIVYNVNFGTCHINTMIKLTNDFITENDIIRINNYDNEYSDVKYRLVKFYDKSHDPKVTINLKGRNTWLINQNVEYCTNNDVIKFYKYMKSTVILPNFLKYLHRDNSSLFSRLPSELIDFTNNILIQENNREQIDEQQAMTNRIDGLCHNLFSNISYVMTHVINGRQYFQLAPK